MNVFEVLNSVVSVCLRGATLVETKCTVHVEQHSATIFLVTIEAKNKVYGTRPSISESVFEVVIGRPRPTMQFRQSLAFKGWRQAKAAQFQAFRHHCAE